MYEKLSLIYDNLMNEDFDFIEWVEYLVKIFSKYESKGQKILDLGCGTGNIAIPLSEKHYKVLGIDISEDMLSIANNKAYEKGADIHLIKGDISKLKIKGNFDIVISCCDTLNYILDLNIMEEIFNNVYNLLESGGLFTFDLNTFYKYKELYGNNTFTYTSEDICYIWDNLFHDQTNIIEYNIDFFVKNESNKYYDRFQEFQKQRAYDHKIVMNLLSKVGFKKIHAYTFNTFEYVGNHDERIQYCALK